MGRDPYKICQDICIIQDTQQAVTRTSKQLRRVQSEGTGMEKQLQQTEDDLKMMTRELEKERREHKQLSEQVTISNNSLTQFVQISAA